MNEVASFIFMSMVYACIQVPSSVPTVTIGTNGGSSGLRPYSARLAINAGVAGSAETLSTNNDVTVPFQFQMTRSLNVFCDQSRQFGIYWLSKEGNKLEENLVAKWFLSN